MSERTYGSSRALSRRLAVLFPHLVLGGGETAMMEVAAGLRECFEVSVCALARRRITVEPTIRRELEERFGSVELARDGDELAAALAGAEAVLWYGLNPLTPGTLERLAPRPTSIRVVHTDKAEEVEYHHRWRHVIDAASCVTPAAARRLPGAVFIPNTASAAALEGEPWAERRAEGRRRKTLGFLGRLLAIKNVDWLVESLAELDCDLLVQGLDTEELGRAELERLAAERGVAERVRFLPPGRRVGTLLKSVDALAVLSAREGFPVVVVEAGLAGTPVIATPVGALPELFGDEILFVELDGGRPRLASVAAALARVDPSWGRRLGERVGHLCDRDRVVGAYAELIEATLARRARDHAAGAWS